jgi:ParB family chromosome partitioning protein
MTIKKRFTIAKELASGIRNSVQAVSNNTCQLHYDLMSVEVIQRDPCNPRKLTISQEELMNGINKNDSNYQIKQKEYEKLFELSESIKKIGVRNAIEVYKHGVKYQIISGERRFLASLLAGQTHIPTRISEKPDEFKLRYMQWVENINREDLSLYEKYNNLTTIAKAYEDTHGTEIVPSILQKILGTSTTQAYRYYSLLKAETEILELVKLHKITNLKVIDELSHIKSKDQKREITQRIKETKNQIASLSNFKTTLTEVQPAQRKILKDQVINLGKVTDKNIARELFQIILKDKRIAKHQIHFIDTNWDSAKTVNKVFKKLVKLIEKEFV